ncbi:MAG: flagellar biosynthesis protein FlhF [Phycisphaerales bacterium]
MKLKTFRANSMADALADVRRDLGPDAVILHTRSFKAGALLGIGGKPMVEITASNAETREPANGSPAPRPGARPTTAGTYTATPGAPRPAASVESKPEPPQVVVPTGVELPSGTRPKVEPRPTPKPAPTAAAPTPAHKPEPTPKPAAPAPEPVPQPAPTQRPQPSAPHPVATTPRPAIAALHAPKDDSALAHEVAELKKMMGQVLQSARQTAVAVGQSGAKVTPGATSGPLFDIYARLIDQDVDADLAEDIAAAARDQLDSGELADPQVVRETVLRLLADMIPVKLERPASLAQRRASDPNAGSLSPRRIALIGPTGVGKTTTVAKLAATYKLRYGVSVGLVTIDTYRIAAVEQLRTYASIIGLPIQVVNTPEEMRRAIDELQECDTIFIDTAGRSQNDAGRLGELDAFIKAAQPDETHLVLSSTASVNTLTRIAERFMPLGPDRCMLTKLDEAVTFGVIVGLCRRVGLPLSFVTTGQEVPDHIEPARPDRLARLVLDGPKPGSGSPA